jgi:hypothetical protein
VGEGDQHGYFLLLFAVADDDVLSLLNFIKLGRKTGTLQGSGCKPVALAMFLDVNPLCANE